MFLARGLFFLILAIYMNIQPPVKTKLVKPIQNKPSFCSGSCNEIHARRKLQNKTSLKYLNFLETHLTLNIQGF